MYLGTHSLTLGARIEAATVRKLWNNLVAARNADAPKKVAVGSPTRDPRGLGDTFGPTRKRS